MEKYGWQKSLARSRFYLALKGYSRVKQGPGNWPVAFEWFRHEDGTWASIERLEVYPGQEREAWVRKHYSNGSEIDEPQH